MKALFSMVSAVTLVCALTMAAGCGEDSSHNNPSCVPICGTNTQTCFMPDSCGGVCDGTCNFPISCETAYTHFYSLWGGTAPCLVTYSENDLSCLSLDKATSKCNTIQANVVASKSVDCVMYFNDWMACFNGAEQPSDTICVTALDNITKCYTK